MPPADEVAPVLAQDLFDVRVRIPAERAPDHLVDVVVAALRVREEADGAGRGLPEDFGLAKRTGVDSFAAFSDGIGHVPVRYRILALAAVRDVGVVPDGIPIGDGGAQLLEIHANLRAINHA